LRFRLPRCALGLSLLALSPGGCGGKLAASGLPDGANVGDRSSPLDASTAGPCFEYCSGVCIDLRTDPNNCGGCGTVCPCGGVCSGGMCMGGSGVRCAGQCTDTMTDPNHCGSCGTACAAGQICVDGACEAPVTCSGVTIDCDNRCFDPTNDALHCGSCHKVCPAQKYPRASADLHAPCEAGACACAPGTVDCGGDYCTDLQTDAHNCGGCGVECVSPLVCNTGQCEASCGPGLTACGLDCVDIQSDPFQCGPHCEGCRALSQVCDHGTCACPGSDGGASADYAYCGVMGCVNLETDAKNCGGCYQVCASGTCRNGGCT
jgi:hypothetical protein